MTQQRAFLDRLSDADRAALRERLRTRRFARGEHVIDQDDADADVFFVLEGRASATIYSREGKKIAYRTIEAGEVFGELAAIDGAPRSATVVALEDLTAGVISVEAFRQTVETHRSVMWALLEHLAAQSRQMTARIFEFSTLLVRERLIEELIRLAEAAGRTADGIPAIDPAPTHFDLAARISAHREAVSREMGKLSRLKIISKRSGKLLVQDLERLRAFRREE